jgi:hypothetical protein
MTSILQPTNIINNGKRKRVDLNAIGNVSHIPRDTRYGYTDNNENNQNNGNTNKTKHEVEMADHHTKQDIKNAAQIDVNKNKPVSTYLSPEKSYVTARHGVKLPPQTYFNFNKPVINQNKPGTGLSGHPELYTLLGDLYIPT